VFANKVQYVSISRRLCMHGNTHADQRTHGYQKSRLVSHCFSYSVRESGGLKGSMHLIYAFCHQEFCNVVSELRGASVLRQQRTTWLRLRRLVGRNAVGVGQ